MNDLTFCIISGLLWIAVAVPVAVVRFKTKPWTKTPNEFKINR
jgi:hypothetical protein